MKLLFCLVILLFSVSGTAQDLVYKPRNPAFGGDTFNYQWMIGSAESQNKFKDKVAFIVVALPLMLLFTGCYIATNNPDAKIFIYDPDDPSTHNITDQTLQEFALILLPNHQLKLLNNIESIVQFKQDLKNNKASFVNPKTKKVDEKFNTINAQTRKNTRTPAHII